MDVRESVERRLELKRKELADLELKLRETSAYIRAMEDMIRLMDGEDTAETSGRGIRADSDVGKSQDAIRRAGKPLHVSELLKSIGKLDDKRSRISLAGTLSGYVKRGHVFTRPGPNTFGLIDLENKPAPQRPSLASLFKKEDGKDDPPEDFGGITDEDVPF